MRELVAGEPDESVRYRCWCGHFEEEHTEGKGCAGCDAGGKDLLTIEHNHVPDLDWPEAGGIDRTIVSIVQLYDPNAIGPDEYLAFALPHKAKEYVEEQYGPGAWIDLPEGVGYQPDDDEELTAAIRTLVVQ